MSDTTLSQLKDALTAALQSAGTGDIKSLSNLYMQLQEIHKTAGHESASDVAVAAATAAELVEHVILQDADVPDDAMAIVTRTVEAIVAMVDGADETVEEDDVVAFTVGADDKDLLENFVVEATDHLHIAEVQLLTLETTPDDAEAVNAVFRSFHTIKGVAAFLGLEHMRTLAHEAEDLLSKARKGQLRLTGEPIDVVLSSVDCMKRLVAFLKRTLADGTPLRTDPHLAALVTRIKAAMEAPTPQPTPPATRDDLRPAEPVRPADEAAPAAEEAATATPRAGGGRLKESFKVDADRLDRLVDTIGELVIAESMVSQSADLAAAASPRLSSQLRLLDKITRELQEMATSLRMKPIRVTFETMARVVRDLAKKAGKQIRFTMSGEDTELDKSLVDRISDPLIHMVRNAVDHGIETPDERAATDKSPVARVNLRAFHKGGSIYIELTDDGRGLDRERILAKARERGIIGPDEELDERETFGLIFQPGFSTAKQVTDISGRGVGMDVVKREIDALRGQVDIRSEQGRGTTFTIRLPLTLAIIDGMVVRVGAERYIIPTLSIVRSVRAKQQDITTVTHKGELFMMQGKSVPLFRLERLFEKGDGTRNLDESIIVVVEDDMRKTGLVVDELVGQQQIVIKSLGETMQGIAGIAGCSIMPDGNVGLIVDIAGLVRLTHTGHGPKGDQASDVVVN